MTALNVTALLVLTALASLAQAAVVPLAYPELGAAPLLPAAVLAAWTAIRGPREVWPALPVPALVLGAVSSERIGWFLLAMLPAVGIAIVGLLLEGDRSFARLRRLPIAMVAAGAAAPLHLAVLALVAGHPWVLVEASGDLFGAAVLTGVLAGALALGIRGPQARLRGLFE